MIPLVFAKTAQQVYFKIAFTCIGYDFYMFPRKLNEKIRKMVNCAIADSQADYCLIIAA